MMEKKEMQAVQLRFGLSLKKILDANKAKTIENKLEGIESPKLIDSYGKLESSSGLRKATLIDVAIGKRNATCTTIAAILEALGLTFSEFGSYYDSISDEEIWEYKKAIEKTRKDREGKKPKNGLPSKLKSSVKKNRLKK